jgi:hypothetical protein
MDYLAKPGFWKAKTKRARRNHGFLEPRLLLPSGPQEGLYSGVADQQTEVTQEKKDAYQQKPELGALE